MSSPVDPLQLPPPSKWRYLWKPVAWMGRFTWWLCVLCWRIGVYSAQAALRVLPITEWGWWKRNVSRLGLRSMPLRRWLVLSLASLFILPILAGSITAVILNLGDDPEKPSAELILGASLDQWNDPAWRAETADELEERGVDFVLYEDGTEIYRTSEDPLEGRDFPGGMHQVDFNDDQMALIYGGGWGPFSEEDDDWPVPVVAIGTLIATFIGMGIFFGRTVVMPLARASAAAEDIAGGDLSIALPGSRVREVAELNAAVVGMASALSESLAHEAKLEQERRFLVGAVAHDLRTPLFALRGSLEAISTGVADTEEKRLRYLATAQEKANMLDRLVSDLFDLTRLEFLEMEPVRESVDLAALVSSSVAAFRPAADQKGIRLVTDDATATHRIAIDAHLVTRAVDNLIDNAIRFTPQEGTVTITCSTSEDGAEIAIADSGPGIPEEEIAQIFEPLYRGEGSRNRQTGGAGLGLTIARRVFVAHGGDLVVRNRESGGASFVATIPAGDRAPAGSPKPG
ncbi:MAG: HAMP domain-containing histidine kinase [Thermomicrobiales bacterium]|nr:HAMP domain-containing histidine kinase [Thermomicrobiales bacterium]